MKKIIQLLLMTIVCMAITGNALSQSTQQVQSKSPESLPYSYSYKTNYFRAGEAVAFMDNNLFPLKVKAHGTEKGDVYISLFDLKRIYAPDFKVSKSGSKFIVEHTGIKVKAEVNKKAMEISGVVAMLPVAPILKNNEICVPVASFMSIAFAKDTRFEQGFVLVGHDQDKIKELDRAGRDFLRLLTYQIRGKNHGFVYRTYWFEEGKRTMSYRMYIPTSYDPEVPNKMILLVHGATVNQNYWFTDTNEYIMGTKPFEEYAEKYGYILAAPNAYVKMGYYGDTEDVPMMFYDGPRKLSEEQKRLRILSGKGFMLGFEDVLKNYNIDSNNIFIMGQSMGAMGTLYLANKYPDKFKSIVVTGMMPNMSATGGNPYPNLVKKPVFFGYGTEDYGGFDLAKKNSEMLAQYLDTFKFHWSAGGHHVNAWARSLEQIFDFLNAQVK